jgi:DNA polymerase-3 subunit beta
MKLICEKDLLLSAALTASRAAARKSPAVLLEGLLLEADGETLKITGFELRTGITTTIPAEIEQSGGIVLNAKLFTKTVRKMSGETVSISVSPDNIAEIKCEKKIFKIQGFPVSDYPELPAVDGDNTFQISGATIGKMISQTIFAVSDNEAKPINTCLLFETRGNELTVVALDGFRLALRREPIDMPKSPEIDFVVPVAAIRELERIISNRDETVTVALNEKYIRFSIGGMTLTSRRLEGKFLDYRNSIPIESKHKIVVSKHELIAAIERVPLTNGDSQKSPIVCLISDGSIKLNSASASGEAVVECRYEGNVEGLEIAFNDKYLLDALKAAPANSLKLELNSEIEPCIITPTDNKNNFLYMVLPINLQNTKKSEDGAEYEFKQQ